MIEPNDPRPGRHEIEAMRRDAARYEWLREHFTQLVIHTDFHQLSPGVMYRTVTLIEIGQELLPPDPGSVDRAIDTQLEREEREG